MRARVPYTRTGDGCGSLHMRVGRERLDSGRVSMRMTR